MSPVRVLLAYANPAITPTPVPPYGMERIAQAFAAAGCDVRLLTPFSEADPAAHFAAALQWQPALVGLSVRNIDDTLVVRGAGAPGSLDTTFYLDAIAPLVAAACAAVGRARVLLGGPGFSAAPEAVLAYLGAGVGIAGPGEDLCLALGEALAAGRGPVLPDDPRVVRAGQPSARGRGFASGYQALPGPTPRMGSYLRLTAARGGRVGVQLSTGCDRRCAFCTEPRLTGHLVIPRPVDEIVAEIDALAAAGFRRLWLTASELNVPTDRDAIALLRRLAGRDLDLAAFLQPAPISDALLDAMEDAGMDPETVNFEFGHLSDAVLRAGGGPASRRAIDGLVETWLRRGYRRIGGSMLLGAHPAETWQTLDEALTAARQIDSALPDGLGLAYACGARVYAETPLAQWITAHPDDAAPHLFGADDPSFAQVVVFSRPAPPRVLLAHVQAALQDCRGPTGAMNAEVSADPAVLAAEALVSRGILRIIEGQDTEAARCLTDALRQVPDHLEALRQLALLQANGFRDPSAASATLQRLLAALPTGDARRGEVTAALQQLRHSHSPSGPPKAP